MPDDVYITLNIGPSMICIIYALTYLKIKLHAVIYLSTLPNDTSKNRFSFPLASSSFLSLWCAAAGDKEEWVDASLWGIKNGLQDMFWDAFFSHFV
jgi:hypothetical protein